MLCTLAALVICRGDLSADLSRLLADPALSRAGVGLVVKDVGGSTLFDSNGDKRLIPASVLKTVTLSACLDSLGAEAKLATRFWRVGKTVFLVGGWDPDLGIGDLLTIRERLAVGPGDKLFFWDRYDDDDATNSGWERGDQTNEDAAAVTALSVSRGRAELWLREGRLSLEPRNFGMTLKRESDGGALRIRRGNDSWVVRIWGKLPDADGRLGSVSLPDPALCAARIVCANAVRRKVAVPADAQSYAVRTLASVGRTTLVESNNHFADTMLRLLGAMRGKTSAWEDSLDVVRSFLGKMGVSSEAYRVSDGSGLSRFNEISPRSIATLFEWMLRSKNGDAFAAMLPAPGEGTLANRLSGVVMKAKTGTMTGVSGLAGYVDIPPIGPDGKPMIGKLAPLGEGRRVVFCMLFNHYPGKAAAVREIQDAIVRRIAQGD